MSEEHALLRDALVGRLSGCDRAAAWDALGEVGVRGLIVPEQLGGAGLAIPDAAPVMQALGETCIATPFLESSIAAARLLAASADPQAQKLMRQIAEDGSCVAVAGLDPRLRGDLRARRDASGWRVSGAAPLVMWATQAHATLVIASVEDDAAVFLLTAAPGLRRSYPTIDGRHAADLELDDVEAILVADRAATLVATIVDCASACIAVEAAAIMRRLVRDTADFVRQREQFGQPIARFQVVQHRIVDMNIQARRAGAIARHAMHALDGSDLDRARAVSAAKVTAAQAGRFVGQQAVQLHGGMGMTEELPIGTMFKRLTVIEGELGSADDALRRFAESAWREAAA